MKHAITVIKNYIKRYPEHHNNIKKINKMLDIIIQCEIGIIIIIIKNVVRKKN